MSKAKVLVIGFVVFMMGFFANAGDGRLIPEVARDANGEIKRDAGVLKQFQKIHPCPSTNNTVGTCPGWIKDHVIPLSCNGSDTVENLQWQKLEESIAKDKWERIVYCKNK